MAKRNSQLTELLIVAQDDYLTIVDTSAGQSKRVSVKNLTGAPDVGWTATGESWSFSSFSSTTRLGVITVPTDATTKYSAGMWIRISQSTGGTKYAYITAVTATTITANFFNLYTLNNEAISTPVYSPLAQPFGTPAIPVKYTDANGWTVYDFGNYKRYVQANAQSTINVPAADRAGFTAVTLPVGVTTVATGYLCQASIAGSTYPGNFFVGIVKNTTITGLIGNNYNGGTLATGAFTLDLEITPL